MMANFLNNSSLLFTISSGDFKSDPPIQARDLLHFLRFSRDSWLRFSPRDLGCIFTCRQFTYLPVTSQSNIPCLFIASLTEGTRLLSSLSLLCNNRQCCPNSHQERRKSGFLAFLQEFMARPSFYLLLMESRIISFSLSRLPVKIPWRNYVGYVWPLFVRKGVD